MQRSIGLLAIAVWLTGCGMLSLHPDSASPPEGDQQVPALALSDTQNEARILIDTSVFDSPTHALLFSGPGIDKVTRETTLVVTAEPARKTQDQSLGRAMDEVTGKQNELKGTANVVHAGSAGPGSSGSVDGLLVFALLLLVTLGRWRQRRRSTAAGS